MPVEESDLTLRVRRRYGVPDALRLRAEPAEVLACLPGYEVAVRSVASRPDDLPAAPYGGRSPLARIATDHGTVLVRAYRKGGLLRHLRGPLFGGRWRPLEELVLHRRLAALNVPVAQAVGCVVLRKPWGWRGFLLVEEVPGALDLEAWLHGTRLPGGSPDAAVLRRAGRSVRRLHDAGVAHADLHPKNLLLAPDGRVLVLDLDKARASEQQLEDDLRLANLVRLGRSIEKHRLKGMRAGTRQALRFLEGYAGSQPAARQWLARVRARLKTGLFLRRIWWRLKGEARPWRPDALRAPSVQASRDDAVLRPAPPAREVGS